MKFTKLKATKFTANQSKWIDGIVDKVNKSKSDEETKLTVGGVMRDATIKEFKKIESKLGK